jgi:DNA-binding transcriptional LysR family regulator
MLLACSPSHPLAGHGIIRPPQLTGEKYIGFDKGLVIRREVDRFLREQGVAVEVALEFDNIENIKKAIEISAGVALLPEPTLRREVEAGTLVALQLTGCRLVRPLGIIHRRQQRLSAAALRFIDLLQEGNDNAKGTKDSGASARANGSHRGRNGAARASRKKLVS